MINKINHFQEKTNFIIWGVNIGVGTVLPYPYIDPHEILGRQPRDIGKHTQHIGKHIYLIISVY